GHGSPASCSACPTAAPYPRRPSNRSPFTTGGRRWRMSSCSGTGEWIFWGANAARGGPKGGREAKNPAKLRGAGGFFSPIGCGARNQLSLLLNAAKATYIETWRGCPPRMPPPFRDGDGEDDDAAQCVSCKAGRQAPVRSIDRRIGYRRQMRDQEKRPCRA